MLEEIKRNYEFYKKRLERAEENAAKGVYLWSKMSEHNAEMHFLKYEVETLKKQLEEQC